ncbi:MAG: tRNA (N(6)-L-threonylcarbamoyladenosine(37)-C(2))-methylthiotransferase MtaB [Eubacterium sp.]|nr:tRNA (N(6)-L-threonylcarbamoyladenosine(37)-C(2))-methylthiotransferase MtaB [Eubacterium sp.]
MRAAFLTLGCKVNFYETEKMMEQFCQRGFEIVDFKERADVYIINTCTVTNMADRKSRQMIHRAKKKNPQSFVAAVGCYVESGGDALLEDPAIDAAFSNRDKLTVAEQVVQRLGLAEGSTNVELERGILSQDRTRSFLKIQDGCNQFCSYCIIPYVRGGGRLVSTPPGEVVSQVRELAAAGYKEVVLTGIHLSSYGVESSDAREFVRAKGEPLLAVVREAARVEGIRRIRLGSLEPRIVSEEFLEGLAQIDEVCPHFHLSLQSGCDTVLQRMNRHYTAVEYKEKVDMLRRYFYEPAVTTDVIVGFPGETEDEFQRTRGFLRDIRLADMHVFKYSPRTGTPAAVMGEQISPELKSLRSDLLISDAEEYRREYGERFIGQTEQVLFEETTVENGETYLYGHTGRYVKVGVPLPEAQEKGYQENEIYEVRIGKILSK